MRLTLLVLIAACGPVGTSQPIARQDPPTEVGPRAAATATCDYSLHGRSCELGSGCRYAAGECACVARYPCSGVLLTEERMARIEAGPRQYICTTTDPTLERADGCPVLVPSGECRTPELACEYPADCGGPWAKAECRGGNWHLERGFDSPPP